MFCSGNEIGKARGILRSDPKEGINFECPCEVNASTFSEEVMHQTHLYQVSSWQKWNDGWKDDDDIIVTKYKFYGKCYGNSYY